MATKKSVTTELVVEKECKNSIRYSTLDKDNEKTLLTIYLLNDAVKALGNPKKIEVTVRTASIKT